jgi:hypothetical protein
VAFIFTMAPKFHDRLGKQGMIGDWKRTVRTSRPVSRGVNPPYTTYHEG